MDNYYHRNNTRNGYNPPLTKPKFIKVGDIKPGHHCYNVYVKIVEAAQSELTKADGEKLAVSEGIAGDETAVARFKIIGEAATLLKKGRTVAIRNGISNVVGGNIRLEINKFGRVTEENVNIDKINTSNDISAVEYERTSNTKEKRERE